MYSPSYWTVVLVGSLGGLLIGSVIATTQEVE
jgi:hypothetical protein